MIIPNPSYVDFLVSTLREKWTDHLHIRSDFDRTITYWTIDGKKTPSLISLLRDGKHLSPDYPDRAIELFRRYHPVEIDPTLSTEDKKPIMKIWWEKHFSLMIECGLKKADVFDVIKESYLRLRRHVDTCLQILRNNNIPVIIISAWAIGDAIPFFLWTQWLDFENIHYICNHFYWDDWGYATSIREPIIHIFNKDETSIREIPKTYEHIKNRKNIILIWDSLWDIGMCHKDEYDNLLKIGFLNSEDEWMRSQYINNFDVIIDWDGDFLFVKECLQNILK